MANIAPFRVEEFPAYRDRLLNLCNSQDGDACLDLGMMILGLVKRGRYSRKPFQYYSEYQALVTDPHGYAAAHENQLTAALELFKKGCSFESSEANQCQACYYLWEYTNPKKKKVPEIQDWLKDDLLSKVKLVAERRCYEKDDADAAHSCYQASRFLMMSNEFDRGFRAFTRGMIRLKKLCQQGDHEACMLQAQSGIEADEREAAEKRACDLGNSDACFLRGLKARDNHDIEGAIQLMERACSESVDGGSVGACWNLAVMHAKGEYTAQDWPRAAQYFERACNLGESKACVLFDRFRTQGNFGKVVPKKSSGSAEN